MVRILKFSTKNSNKVDIYHFIDFNIGNLITDLIESKKRGYYKMDSSDEEGLKDLIEARISFLNWINTRGIIIGTTDR